MHDEKTVKRGYPLPHGENYLEDDVERLRDTFFAIELDMENAFDGLKLLDDNKLDRRETPTVSAGENVVVEKRGTDYQVHVPGNVPPLPLKPTLKAPMAGLVRTSTPTLILDGYTSPMDIPFAGARFYIEEWQESDESWVEIYISKWIERMAYTLPEGILQAGRQVRFSGEVRDEVWGVSPRSPAVECTMADVLKYVVTPSVVSPTEGQDDIARPLLVSLSPFRTVGSADAHAKSRCQLIRKAGNWDDPLWDSGEVDELLKLSVPDGLLEPGKEYAVRALHVGENLGASDWSVPVPFSTRATFANIFGVQIVGQTAAEGAKLAHIDLNGKEISLTPADFNAHPAFGGAAEFEQVQIGENEDLYRKIPIAYWWRGYIDGKWSMLLSDTPGTFSGRTFRANGAVFKDGDAWLPYIRIAEYRAYYNDGKPGSRPGQTSWYGASAGVAMQVTWTNVKKYCESLGEGHHLLSLQEWYEICARAVIERKTFLLRSANYGYVWRGIKDFCCVGSPVYYEWVDAHLTDGRLYLHADDGTHIYVNTEVSFPFTEDPMTLLEGGLFDFAFVPEMTTSDRKNAMIPCRGNALGAGSRAEGMLQFSGGDAFSIGFWSTGTYYNYCGFRAAMR